MSDLSTVEWSALYSGLLYPQGKRCPKILRFSEIKKIGCAAEPEGNFNTLARN
jgi:hypothetical protein